MKSYIKLARPQNWVKNIFVFIPIVFALNLTDVRALIKVAATFVSFSAVSSAIYIFNDIKDRESDSKNPVKCRRPIAAGIISVKAGALMCAWGGVFGIGLSLCINKLTAMTIIIYIVENVIYTIWLKHVAIFDVFCIAIGFILRVYAGAFAYNGTVSEWLFLTVFAMSLFMGFGKRRGEMMMVASEAHRNVLRDYDISFLNGILFATSTMAVVFYSFWAMWRGFGMIYTTPLIVFIVCRYLLRVYSNDSYGDPTTVILGDRTISIACVLYAIVVVCLFYL